MRSHMSSNWAWLWKSAITNVALKWLFSAMCPTVSCQIGCLRERLVAFIAAIRPLARMCSHMSLQSTRSGVPIKKSIFKICLWFNLESLTFCHRHYKRSLKYPCWNQDWLGDAPNLNRHPTIEDCWDRFP